MPRISLCLLVCALSLSLIVELSVAFASEEHRRFTDDDIAQNAERVYKELSRRLDKSKVSSWNQNDLTDLEYYIAAAHNLNKVSNTDIDLLQVGANRARETGSPQSVCALNFWIYYSLLKQTSSYIQAREVFDECLNIAKESNDVDLVTEAYLNLGIMHSDFGLYQRSEEFFHLSIEESKKSGNMYFTADIYFDLANLHIRTMNYEAARVALQKQIEYSKRLYQARKEPLEIRRLGIAYTEMAIFIDKTLNDVEASLKFYLLAYDQAKEAKDSIGMLITNKHIMRTYNRLNRFDDALDAFGLVSGLIDTESVELSKLILTNRIERLLSLTKTDSPNLLKEISDIDALLVIEKGTELTARELKEYNYYKGLALSSIGKYKESADALLKSLSFAKQELAKEKETFQKLKINSNQIIMQGDSKISEQYILNLVLGLSIAIALLLIAILFLYLKHQVKIKELYAELAMNDELTGAPNRRAILEFANEQFSSMLRYKKKMVIAILDIDHFKKINDTYGHDIGDETLKLFAKTVMSNLRTNEKVGRYGGEEWLVIMPDATATAAVALFERLCDKLEVEKENNLPSDLSLTFSMGVVSFEDDNQSLKQAIALADNRLYSAKEGGRNMCVYSD